MNKYFKFLDLLLPVYKKNFYIIVFFSLLYSIIETVSIVLIIPLMNALLNNNNLQHFEYFFKFLDFKETFQLFGLEYNQKLFFLTLYILVFFAKNIYYIIFSYYSSSFYSNVEANIATRYFENDILGSVNSFNNKNSSEVIRDSNALASIYSSNFLMGLTSLFLEFFTFVLIFLSISYIYFYETIFILCLLIIFTLVNYIYLRNKIYFLAKKIELGQAIKIRKVIESFDLFKEIKIFNLYKKFFSNYSREVYLVSKYQRLLGFFRILNKPFLELIFVIILFFYLLSVISTNEDFSTFLIKLSIFIAAAFRFLPSINRLNVTVQRLRASLPLIENLYLKIRKYSFYKERKISPLYLRKNITIKGLSFSHVSDNQEILSNINLTIKRGSSILILGKSGSGKSTFVELIMGLIKPTKGKIMVDGKNITQNINGWFSRISYIPQKINLIDDSIENNIIYFSNKKNNLKIQKILSLSKLNELRDKIVNKIFIGERGKRLSGGQVQRVGIARGLLKDADLLIIDEGTSALDNKNEDDIVKELVVLDKNITIIFITHKKRLAKYFDKVYHIKDKKFYKIKG
jgi:ABC-type multidrug transport system fused ATPase/permease subunit